MKVGYYVRTKYGIKQIYEIDNNKTVWKYKFKLKKQDGDGCVDLGCFSDNDVIKSSPNIIDLIEAGDYVNGIKITDIGNDNKGKYVFGYGAGGMEGEIWYYNNEIKSIVTKEAFKSMEYRIGG